jgi:hypothetical protein
MDEQIFSLSLMSVSAGKAKVDGWAGEGRLAMPLNVERRLCEFGGVWLGVGIGL